MPNELITASSRELATELTAYDEKMLSVFEYLGLPTNNILVKVDERRSPLSTFMAYIEHPSVSISRPPAYSHFLIHESNAFF